MELSAYYVPRIGLCGLCSLRHLYPHPAKQPLLDKFFNLHEDTNQLGNTQVLTDSRTEFKLISLNF